MDDRTLPLSGLSRSSAAPRQSKPNPFAVPIALQQESSSDSAAFSVTPTSSRLAGPSTPRGSSTLQVESSVIRDICDACSACDLERLKASLAQNGSVFKLVNSAHPQSGLSPLQLASSRGCLPIVEYLLEECGALVDLDDAAGESPIHSAAYRGHLEVVRALIEHSPEAAEARDSDGWTALHNAAARGRLSIVQLLVERGVDADAQSVLGFSALMCAASRGQLPVVAYLLSKQVVDPLLRNTHGETAYDTAVASFEIHIADLLAASEQRARPDYNSLALHTLHAVVLHENQRLDQRKRGRGAKEWTSRTLSRTDRRSPFTLLPDHQTALRSEIGLPTLSQRDELVIGEQGPTTERSWFWMSNWFVDLTPSGIDLDEGWQYAHSFDAPPEAWTAQPPAESTSDHKWVRRRRWARVMRRRLDLPPWGFADVRSMPKELNDLPNDYLARAKWSAGVNHIRSTDAFSVRSNSTDDDSNAEPTRVRALKAIGRLESAIIELKEGAAKDTDAGRRRTAEALIEAYSDRLADMRSMISEIAVVDDDEFVYQPSPASSRPATPSPPIPARRTSSLAVQPDLTPVLANADFRVPTNETPAPRPFVRDRQLSSPAPITWQADESVEQCPLCSRRFTFFLRRHHCRRCGRVVCHTCSPYFDPLVPSGLPVRTCTTCHHDQTTTTPSPSIPPSPLLSSVTSEMTECPVCTQSLIGIDAAQHLRICLDSGTIVPSQRLLISRLPADSALVGTECVVRRASVHPADARRSASRSSYQASRSHVSTASAPSTLPVYDHGSHEATAVLFTRSIEL